MKEEYLRSNGGFGLRGHGFDYRHPLAGDFVVDWLIVFLLLEENCYLKVIIELILLELTNKPLQLLELENFTFRFPKLHILSKKLVIVSLFLDFTLNESLFLLHLEVADNLLSYFSSLTSLSSCKVQ
jgi:hypothetical protein